MIEKMSQKILKGILIMIMESRGVDSSKLTDEHLDNLWKISKNNEGTERDEKLTEYLKTYVL